MIELQKKLGIKPDGVFGPITANAITKHMRLSREEAAHFLGQCFVESAGFTVTEESLFYTTEALLIKVFGKYFASAQINDSNGKVLKKKASDFLRKPAAVANWAYANRMGNGPESSGDGWKHRGFGYLQTTGSNNQNLFADYVKDPRIKDKPELIGTEYPFESARFYFDSNNAWKHATTVTDRSILGMSRLINLGRVNHTAQPNHLVERSFHTKRIYSWLNG